MPYQIHWEDRGVAYKYEGHASEADIAAATRHVQADARYDRLLYSLHDFLACESFTFSPAAMEEMAAVNAAAARSLRAGKLAIAVVTDREEVVASVHAYVGSGLCAHDFRIFDSVVAARAWLKGMTRQ